MIIAFADDQTATLYPDIASARGYCEAVDVEDGVYQFFDEYGRRLKPRIITPVRRTSLPLGVKLIGGGNFDLDLDPDEGGVAFEDLLAKTVAIEPAECFATPSDLGDYVRQNRRRLR
jgi:hypothetical protein